MMKCNIYPKVPARDQKIIIFDSPDGTGKTEIATALSKELGIPYFRMATQHENWRKGRFKEALEFDQTYLAEFLRQTKTDVIIDRAYPAEWVYSKVYGRQTNPDVLCDVDDAFARMGAYIVIPLRHDYTKARGDEVVTPDKLIPLHHKYLDFRHWTRCSTITMYVDAFQNKLEKQIPLLLREFSWGEPINFKTNVILDHPFEKQDISELFRRNEPLAGRETDLVSLRKAREEIK